MNTSRRDLMRWQFDLTWSLSEYHLERLVPEDFLWEPSPLSWTVRPAPDGTWVTDWAETEPDPVPTPTIAWLTWHIDWWWSVALDHVRSRAPRDRAEITWPGDGEAAVARLRALREEWLTVLEHLDEPALDAPATFPWQDDPQYTVAHTIAWVNAELMKNVTEIGQLRLLRAASRPASSDRIA
ncbi:DinB family protein [Actinocorallia populi]|uniref:DinB family protein n=1 Tax=Actinocorallia populi TaxID=2079200 RepID=UPI000D090039|nr:DinB family protein [Actinocorallia populi]